MKIVFSNIVGNFELDNGRFRETKEKGKDLDKESIKKILPYLKNKKYFFYFHKNNIALAKKRIKVSVKNNIQIIQAISTIDDLNRLGNSLAKRLREWYSIYNPELSEAVHSHEKFTELMLKKSKKELLKELKIKENESMGADLEKEDIEAISDLGTDLDRLYKLKEKQERYIENIMKNICPNLQAIAGTLIGAKLIHFAGSLEKLSRVPSSTIQLYGAEKALFRHMITGSRSPKHGIILQHPFVSEAKKSKRGKMARILADKISIASKVDYFKGEFVGDKLKKDMERQK